MNNEKDNEFSKEILMRDRYICRLCTKPATEVHHIVRRNILSVRYDPINGISLCFKCHKSVHGWEIQFAKIERVMMRIYGVDWFIQLMKKQKSIL